MISQDIGVQAIYSLPLREQKCQVHVAGTRRLPSGRVIHKLFETKFKFRRPLRYSDMKANIKGTGGGPLKHMLGTSGEPQAVTI